MSSSTFFPRGNGPLISFLLPSRGRPEGLQYAIQKAYDLAKDKDSIEFLLRLDEDDEVTKSLIPSLVNKYKGQIHIYVKPRGNGYADLHLMVNELASQARGDWLFLYNDDSEILTPGYDQVILNITSYNKFPGISEVCLLQFKEFDDPRSYSFIALRRQTFDSIGKFSAFPHCDLWLFTLMNCVDAVLPCDVSVKHNQVAASGKTGKEAVSSVIDVWRKMKNTYAISQRLSLADLLLRRIIRFRSLMKWENEPKTSGWYWWKKPNEDATSGYEIPMVVFKDLGKYRINLGNESKIIEGGDSAVGPSPGSDCKSMVYSIKELGGEWCGI